MISPKVIIQVKKVYTHDSGNHITARHSKGQIIVSNDYGITFNSLYWDDLKHLFYHFAIINDKLYLYL